MNESVKRVLDLFERINQIPRCSKNEKEICSWLVSWAKEHGFQAETDEIMNVLIKVPASKGKENAPIIVLQGHMDMVCEKTPDSTHDFSKDPIVSHVEGEWLKADRTTLGADNGIALAMAMAIAEDKKISHPALELLFTVDEETGLTGANGLKPGFIKGKILINIDSEDEGVFTVGCAGGKDTRITLPLQYDSADKGNISVKISVGGLMGGHSGVDIREPRANANILLAQTLHAVTSVCDCRLVSLKGGSAHNAIPRDAEAVISLKEKEWEVLSECVAVMEKNGRNEFSKLEKGMFITAAKIAEKHEKVFTKERTGKVIDLFLSLPHGIAAMSQEIPGLVETSNNFATVRMEEGVLNILTSQRSSVMTKLQSLTYKIESIARLAGAEAKRGNGYPSWEPDMDSELLAKCVSLYKELFKKEPVVEIIHAGLECGIIGSKNKGMDMISLGPTIKNPHSPDEKMYIPSLEKVWQFMVALLGSF